METVSPVDARPRMGYESVDGGKRMSDALNYPGPMPVESMLLREPDRSHQHGSSARDAAATSPTTGLFGRARAGSDHSAPRLESSSSNVSNSTAGDTDITSPEPSSLNVDPHVREKPAVHCSAVPTTRPRPRTPNIDAAMGLDGVIPSPTSPMAADAPAVSHGQKRTASGTVKERTQHLNGMTGAAGTRRSNHSRTMSTESGMGRASELSAQLKARLSYAMVKVQNGWERHTLDELESIAQSRWQRGPPSTPSESSTTPTLRRRSVFDAYVISPGGIHGTSPAHLPTSNRISHGHSRSTGLASVTSQLHHATAPFPSSAPANDTSNGPSLAPAPEITSSFSATKGAKHPRRNTTSRVPPPLRGGPTPQSISDSATYVRAGADGPRTPTQSGWPAPGGARSKLLRMPSQQAEKDAVDSLLFMSSPNNSAAFNTTDRGEAMGPGLGGQGMYRVNGAGR